MWFWLHPVGSKLLLLSNVSYHYFSFIEKARQRAITFQYTGRCLRFVRTLGQQSRAPDILQAPGFTINYDTMYANRGSKLFQHNLKPCPINCAVYCYVSPPYVSVMPASCSYKPSGAININSVRTPESVLLPLWTALKSFKVARYINAVYSHRKCAADPSFCWAYMRKTTAARCCQTILFVFW